MYRRVADFYDGKSVLLTGATGFLGGVLLELLLRQCPGIIKVYLVLREKKGVSPQERKVAVMGKLIFERLKEEQPDIVEKVLVVPGDTSLPNFGMCEEDLQKVIREVSIVFHCAASISFTKTMMFTLTHNVLSVKYAIDLSRKLQQLDVFVYSSTAYSNCNRPLKTVENIVYRLPYTGQRYISALEKNDAETVEYLAKNSGPTWPNTYTFSKCLAENILVDMAQDLPVAIVRPSVIINSWKGSRPGYCEAGSAITMICLAVGKGFLRVIQCNQECSFDMIPADTVANAHVLAAFKVAARRCDLPLVVNCATKIQNRQNFYLFSRDMLEIVYKRPLKGSLQLPDLVFKESNIAYWITSLLEHYAPAAFFDLMLKITGKKPRLLKLYNFLEQAMGDLEYFLSHEFDQNDTSLRSLTDGLHEDDAETLTVNLDEFRLLDVVHSIPDSFETFKDQDQREKIFVYVRTGTASVIKYSIIALALYVLYMFSMYIFQIFV